MDPDIYIVKEHCCIMTAVSFFPLFIFIQINLKYKTPFFKNKKHKNKTLKKCMVMFLQKTTKAVLVWSNRN